MLFRRLLSTSAAVKNAMSTSSSGSKAERFAVPIDANKLPKGFRVAATHAGIKAAISPATVKAIPGVVDAKTMTTQKPDLALITADVPVAAAGTFTRNVFKAAPVVLSSDLLIEGSRSARGARIKSILVNSGCANAVTGQQGYNDAKECAQLVSQSQSQEAKPANQTLLLSTGVIGVPLPMQAIKSALPRITSEDVLRNDEKSWWDVARAFMTTDTFPKLRVRSFELAGRTCNMVGIDKGAGMIHPNMAGPGSSASTAGLHATLLGLVCTDAPVEPASLQIALEQAVAKSFNCISVDGDMSTNDTIVALASGLAEQTNNNDTTLAKGDEISQSNHPQQFTEFVEVLTAFCTELAHLIVRDGEGATKFVQITVNGTPTYADAHAIASTISTSALVKCALHGSDANWGRILCAVGYTNTKRPLESGHNSLTTNASDWQVDPTKICVEFRKPASASSHGDDIVDRLIVLQNGTPQHVDEQAAKRLLDLEDIEIVVDVQGGDDGGKGGASATYWTCDYSKEYIAINGDYRS